MKANETRDTRVVSRCAAVHDTRVPPGHPSVPTAGPTAHGGRRAHVVEAHWASNERRHDTR
eukprot:scaffold97287_cov48-Phaeocystis_antarctica.AAC.1